MEVADFEKEWVHASGAARLLGIERQTLDYWVGKPGFPESRKLYGFMRVFRKADIIAWGKKHGRT